MSEEQWKTIPGWDQYMVSDLGRVKRIPGWDAKGRYRIKGGLIKPVPVKLATDPRYRPLCVSLSAGGRALCIKVAILVLLAFRGQPTKEKNCARHLDDNQENNQLINLAWGSQKDNAEDRIRNGKTSPGAKNGNSKITEEQATNIIQELKQTFKYRGVIQQISKKLKVPYSCVQDISKGVTWKHLIKKENFHVW